MVVKACISDTHTLDKSVFLTIVHRRQPPIAAIEHLTQKFDTWQGTFLTIVHVKVGAYFQDITDVGDYFSDASWPQWWPSMWSPRTLSRHQPELALESNAHVHPGQLAEQRPLYVWCACLGHSSVPCPACLRAYCGFVQSSVKVAAEMQKRTNCACIKPDIQEVKILAPAHLLPWKKQHWKTPG